MGWLGSVGEGGRCEKADLWKRLPNSYKEVGHCGLSQRGRITCWCLQWHCLKWHWDIWALYPITNSSYLNCHTCPFLFFIHEGCSGWSRSHFRALKFNCLAAIEWTPKAPNQFSHSVILSLLLGLPFFLFYFLLILTLQYEGVNTGNPIRRAVGRVYAVQ